MDGFRNEMNLTLVMKKTTNDSSAQCAGEDEQENIILVRTCEIQ